MAQLVLRFPSGEEKVIDLHGADLRIGRDPGNDLPLENDLISSHHATLRFDRDQGGYSLLDLGSQNGTYVNGCAVQTQQLHDGDVISFATCQAQFIDAETARPGKVTQRITFDALAEQSASFWSATVENKRRELTELERQIEALQRPAAVGNEAPEAAEKDGTLASEVARLETRQTEIQDKLLSQTEKLELIVELELPDAQERLAATERALTRAQRELQELGDDIAAARAKVMEMREKEEQIPRLQGKIDSLYREHDYKKAAYHKTVDELLEAETKLSQARARLEEIQRTETEVLAKTEQARVEFMGLSSRHAQTTVSLEERQAALEKADQDLAAKMARLEDLQTQDDILTHELSQLDESLRLAEAKLSDATTTWDDIEKTRLGELVQTKDRLERGCEAAEERLETAQTELARTQAEHREAIQAAEDRLTDLQNNHYEPARELIEELTLRNEELVREIAEREQRLEKLEHSIEESEQMEQLLRDVLAKKGRALKSLEKRIGEEADKIAAQASGFPEPPTPTEPPRLPEFGPIFVPRERCAAPLSSAQRLSAAARATQVKLVVFEPASRLSPMDFTGLTELAFHAAPLPVGFEGLAAATRGAFETALPEAARRELPVLFLAGDDLAANLSSCKKLRAALPSHPILLGWRSQVFLNVTETLHRGANFQDLTALLATSDGSVTTDPYMNTFFDSLNQGKRFLYLPPALPWDPAARKPYGKRAGIYVDAESFQPENLAHLAVARELKQIVEASRQPITIPEISAEVVARLKQESELDGEWVKIVPAPDYAQRLDLLEGHLAAVAFPAVGLESPLLRDVLLSRALLLAPACEPMQIFYPEAATVPGILALPEPSRIVPILESAERFNRVITHAEKVLLETYCYQAVARRLDEFVGGLTV